MKFGEGNKNRDSEVPKAFWPKPESKLSGFPQVEPSSTVVQLWVNPGNKANTRSFF